MAERYPFHNVIAQLEGWSDDRIEQERVFAVAALDPQDARTVHWLSCIYTVQHDRRSNNG